MRQIGQRTFLALLLVLVMLVGMLTACGRGDPSADTGSSSRPKASSDSKASADEEQAEADEPEDNENDPEENSGDVAYQKGQELTEFVNNYIDAKQVPMDLITEKFDESQDPTLSMSLLGVAVVDLSIAFVPMFDVVDETGFVMFLNLKNAYRKTNGDVITFGADYKREEDSGTDLKGDREFWEGKLDTRDESLSLIYYTERGGKMIDRTVMEITKNKDNSYTSQTLSYTADDGDGGVTNAYFIQFEGEDIDILSGNVVGGKADFDYKTVFKLRNADIRELAKPYELTLDISFKDGEVKSNLKE